MSENEITLLHNMRGQWTVLREIVIALTDQQPAGPAALARALTSATRLREACVNSRQPDALIAAMDVELQFFATRQAGT